MAQLPEKVVEAWEEREGPIVLTTVDNGGKPNSIYATVDVMLRHPWLASPQSNSRPFSKKT